MSQEDPDRTLPRPALLGMIALVLAAMVTAGAARVTEIGTTRNPTSTPMVEVALHFDDREDGAVVVHRDEPYAVVEVYDPGTNGFVRGVLRGLARDRMLRGIGSSSPFLLTRWNDGRHTLSDPETGRSIELEPFGPDNAGVFARLLVTASAES